MGLGSVRIIPNRVLLVDGDGLAYYCAGKDGSSIGDARTALVDKVNRAKKACGAESVLILITGSGSIKGHRYAVATVKPYQGQRENSRRPENWRGLRDYMDSSDFPFPTEVTYTVEADDLFGKHASSLSEPPVIYTQDKDMRMLSAWHLDWVDHTLLYVPPGCYSLERNGKVYGLKWFWLQMLHGDTADNIPGLPKYKVHSKDGSESLKPVGPVTASKILDGCTTPYEARDTVSYHYAGYYGDTWRTAMLEQAILLWMRLDLNSSWDCVVGWLRPLGSRNDTEHREWDEAYKIIQGRIDNADRINAANDQQVNSVAGTAAAA